MLINTYLYFAGNCEEAFKFYVETLHGKIEMMMKYGGSPMGGEMSPEQQEKVMHVKMTVGTMVLMGADCPPQKMAQPAGFGVSISHESVAETERIYKAFCEGGTIQMPLEKTFWAARFGMVTDRFGTPWILNCESGE